MRPVFLTMADMAGTLQGPQGIPGGVMAWRGAYNAGTTYAINDAVYSGGSGYYSLVNNNIGHTPPVGGSNSYWSIFALAGSFDIHGLTAKTVPVLADEVPIYSIANSANRKSTIQQIIGVVLADAGIADAITKKHTQGTDTGLDTGGSNPVTAAQLRLVLAKANRNTDQSIPSGAVTAIAYNNELVDTHSAFNPATGVFTVPVAGYHRVTTMTRFASKAFAAGDELSTGVLVNGGEEGKTFGTFMPASFTASYLCGGSYITTWLAVNATIQAAVYGAPALG